MNVDEVIRHEPEKSCKIDVHFTLSVTEKVTNGPTRTLLEQYPQERKP